MTGHRKWRSMMGKHEKTVPEQETRGGNRVDWKQAKPGEPLPEMPQAEYPEPDSQQLPLWDDEFDLGGE